MKILVTGLSGFIGRHVAESLLEKKYEIVGIIRPNTHPKRIAAFQDKIDW